MRVNHERAQGLDVVGLHSAEKRRRRVEREERTEDTFSGCAHQFIKEHARRKNRGWRDTAKMLGLSYPDDGRDPVEIKGGLASRWRDKPITEITSHDLYGVVNDARRRGIPGMKTRVEGLSDGRGRMLGRCLGRMFSWLTEHRKLEINPFAGVHVPGPHPARDRVLTSTEIKHLWRACQRVGTFGSMVQLLLLTGARRTEVAQMVQVEISEDGSTWTIPGTRTKNGRTHVVPLSAAAREIISAVRPPAVKPGYIFSTTAGRAPVRGYSKLKTKLDKAMREEMGDAFTEWRLHDLRRTAVTGMISLGVPVNVVELCVNHISGHKAGVAGIYNRAEMMLEREAALERWGRHVKALVSGKAGDVVELKASRRRAR
jgi:integrase